MLPPNGCYLEFDFLKIFRRGYIGSLQKNFAVPGPGGRGEGVYTVDQSTGGVEKIHHSIGRIARNTSLYIVSSGSDPVLTDPIYSLQSAWLSHSCSFVRII
jgi:hypothetical protein